MRLYKIIHNHIYNKLDFDEAERDILIKAFHIINDVQVSNVHSYGVADAYLDKQCTNILEGLAGLIDDYSNEYVGD